MRIFSVPFRFLSLARKVHLSCAEFSRFSCSVVERNRSLASIHGRCYRYRTHRTKHVWYGRKMRVVIWSVKARSTDSHMIRRDTKRHDPVDRKQQSLGSSRHSSVSSFSTETGHTHNPSFQHMLFGDDLRVSCCSSGCSCFVCPVCAREGVAGIKSQLAGHSGSLTPDAVQNTHSCAASRETQEPFSTFVLRSLSQSDSSAATAFSITPAANSVTAG